MNIPRVSMLSLVVLFVSSSVSRASPLDNKLNRKDQSNVINHFLTLAKTGGVIATDNDGSAFNNGKALPGVVDFYKNFHKANSNAQLAVITGRAVSEPNKVNEARKWFDQAGIKTDFFYGNIGDPNNAINHKCQNLAAFAKRGPVFAFVENDPDAVRALARTAMELAKMDPVCEANLKNFHVVMVGKSSSQHWDPEAWATNNVNNPNWTWTGITGKPTTAGSILRIDNFLTQ